MSARRTYAVSTGKDFLDTTVKVHKVTEEQFLRRARKFTALEDVFSAEYAALSRQASPENPDDESRTAAARRKQSLKKRSGFFIGGDGGGAKVGEKWKFNSLAALDMDALTPESAAASIEALKALGVRGCIYSTASHSPEKPRLRAVLFLRETVSRDDYAHLIERLATRLPEGAVALGESTKPTQIMYWAQRCRDGEEFFLELEGGPLDVKPLLAEPRAETSRPRAKGPPAWEIPGIVGRVAARYMGDLDAAIEEVGIDNIPYTRSDNGPSIGVVRYTRVGASGFEGARWYCDDGHMYSDHGFSDPGAHRQQTIFDIVRLTRFRDLDRDLPKDTPIAELHSQSAAEKWWIEKIPDLAPSSDTGFTNLDEEETAAVATPEAPATDGYSTRIDKTDVGNANLLIKQAQGNLRYVAETGQWMRWTDNRWHIDEHETFARTAALEVARYYLRQADQFAAAGDASIAAGIRKWATKCRQKTTLDAMLSEARRSPGVPIKSNMLDRSPWLLGVQNGVVDLRTGKLREIEGRDDYVTRRCAVRYNPDAEAPRWRQFIDEVTAAPIPADYDADGEVIPASVGRFTPRPALARYLQKALGYTITGSTREQKFFIAIGGGSNGKNGVFDAMKRVLGGYGNKLPSDALMAAARAPDPERPTSLVAGLEGARFVIASETHTDQRLDVNAIKNHTGDAEITAREVYQRKTTFTITHKIWLATNNQPELGHIDDAIRGRLHLVRFDRKWNRPGEIERDPALPDGDKTLKDRLAAEDEGILTWLIEGALLYQQEGLTPPAEVVASTRAYIKEQDYLGQWLAVMHRCPPREGVRASEAFSEFVAWCMKLDIPVRLKQRSFSMELRRRGVPMLELEDGNHYGIRSQAASATAEQWKNEGETPQSDAAASGTSKPEVRASASAVSLREAKPAAAPKTTASTSKTNGAQRDPAAEIMKTLKVGPNTAAAFVQAGFTSCKKIAEAAPAELVKVRPQFTSEGVVELQKRARAGIAGYAP